MVPLFWAQGNLAYKFKPAQREMKLRIAKRSGFKYVLKCSRRLGKSYFLCATAIEMCLNKPYALVRYGAPTGKALKKIVIPIMRAILRDCPEELRPEWKAAEQVFIFKNGSEIHLAGLNTHPDNLRGTACDLFIIDEAGTVNELSYIIDDIAMPQFLDPSGDVVSDRLLLIASSPARTPAHEFTDIANQAEVEGDLSHFTIYDGGYPNNVIELFKKEAGGENSTTWKREYLAKDVVDENYALCREWDDKYVAEPEIDELFQFYFKYIGLDIGVRDLSVGLAAHYDFKRAKLYIHDEFAMNGPDMTTKAVADGVVALERKNFEQWYLDNGLVEPASKPDETPDEREARLKKLYDTVDRISDVDLKLVNDMRAIHRLYFKATDKESLEAMVNKVRLWVADGRVIISPKCVQLLGCVRYGVWNESRREFDRSKAYGHFDAFAALMYLVRNVNDWNNPVPALFGVNRDNIFIPNPPKSNADKLKEAFNVRNRR